MRKSWLVQECIKYKMTDTKQNVYDRCAGKLLSFFLIINILNITIKQTFTGRSFLVYITPVFGVLYLGQLILYRNKIQKSFNRIFIGETICIFLIAVSVLRNIGAAGAILHRWFWVVAFCIPLSMTASHVKDYTLYLEQTKRANAIAFFCALFSFVSTYIRYGGFTYENYNMEICYALLFPLFCHFIWMKKRKRYMIPVIIEFMIISIYGSRGQLLCIAIFIMLYILKQCKFKYRFLLITSLGGMVSLFCFFPQEIANTLSPIVGRFGSRTLSMLIKGRIMYDSGRFDIWRGVWSKIEEKPILGWGIAGNMTYLKSSPHNIFLEILFHYGIPIGCVIVFFIILVNIYMVLIKKKDEFFTVLMASAFVPLLLSNSYTQAPLFWIFIASGIGNMFRVKRGQVALIAYKKVL